jgi:hypothetical protein
MSQSDMTTLREAVTKLNERYEELKEFALTVSLSKKLEVLDQLELLNIKITRMESGKSYRGRDRNLTRPPMGTRKSSKVPSML